MGEYAVILADPPWQYRVYDDASAAYGAARSSFPTMSTQAISLLPIGDLAAKNAALFLWVTMPCLLDGLAIIDAWGFQYKTAAFTWVKTTQAGGIVKGIGHYTQSNAELCLLGVKGRVTRKARNVSQIIQARRRGHSRKPDEQYERIMRLFDGPYIECFARQQWPGWDVWGNQTGVYPAQPFLMPESMGWEAV